MTFSLEVSSLLCIMAPNLSWQISQDIQPVINLIDVSWQEWI